MFIGWRQRQWDGTNYEKRLRQAGQKYLYIKEKSLVNGMGKTTKVVCLDDERLGLGYRI